MKAIELEMTIGSDGSMKLPETYHRIYGQHARVVILVPEPQTADESVIDPMQYAGTLDWPVDGLTYQRALRDEWA